MLLKMGPLNVLGASGNHGLRIKPLRGGDLVLAPAAPRRWVVGLCGVVVAVLRRLAYANHALPGSCCACLQNMETRGHLPSCPIHLALIAIETWRE